MKTLTGNKYWTTQYLAGLFMWLVRTLILFWIWCPLSPIHGTYDKVMRWWKQLGLLFKRFTSFQKPYMWKSGFGNAICLYGCLLISTWMVGCILFIFSTEEFIHYRSVLGQYEHSSSKKRGSSHRHQTSKWWISRKWLQQFWFNFGIFLGNHPKWNCKGEIFLKITLNALETQKIMHHIHVLPCTISNQQWSIVQQLIMFPW